MEKLVTMLKRIEERNIPASTTFSQDFVDILNWSKNTSVDRNVVRDYLMSNNYTFENPEEITRRSYICATEDEIDMYTRDLYTQYLVMINPEHKKELEKLLKIYFINHEGTVDMEKIRQFSKISGYKCYPVSYSDKGVIAGIITKVGHIMVKPLGIE